jgi:hypothetical protein
MKKLIYVFLLLSISPVILTAQDTLSTNRGLIDGEIVDIQEPQKFYDPKVASRRSAIIPGWGQIYNDSWWKVPILYAGLGVCIYFVDYNHQEFKFWEGVARDELAKPPDQQDSNLLRQAQARADNWRSNRDLVFLTTLGVYGLQIIEASIDAHLKGFNVDDELAINLKPKVGIINNGAAYIGIGVTLPIGK